MFKPTLILPAILPTPPPPPPSPFQPIHTLLSPTRTQTPTPSPPPPPIRPPTALVLPLQSWLTPLQLPSPSMPLPTPLSPPPPSIPHTVGSRQAHFRFRLCHDSSDIDDFTWNFWVIYNLAAGPSKTSKTGLGGAYHQLQFFPQRHLLHGIDHAVDTWWDLNKSQQHNRCVLQAKLASSFQLWPQASSCEVYVLRLCSALGLTKQVLHMLS